MPDRMSIITRSISPLTQQPPLSRLRPATTHSLSSSLCCAIITAGISVLSCNVGPLQAQEALEYGDEIEVLHTDINSARTRIDRLSTSPSSSTTLDDEFLFQQNISNVRDLQGYAPGLLFYEQDTPNPVPLIRGLGQRDADVSLESGVGLYLNGMNLPYVDTYMLDLLDTARVQVLRGPQGYSFGRGHNAGALLIDTLKPSINHRDSSVNSEIDSFSQRSLSGSTNIPFADRNVAARVAVSALRRDDYLSGAGSAPDGGSAEHYSLLARVFWQTNDEVYLDGTLIYHRRNDDGSNYQCFLENHSAPISQQRYQAGLRFDDACQASGNDNDLGQTHANDAGRNELELLGLSVTASWDFEHFNVKSISSFQRVEQIRAGSDTDGSEGSALLSGSLAHLHMTDASPSPVQFGDEQRQVISEELRFSGSALEETMSYVYGLYISMDVIESSPWARLNGLNSLSLTDDLPVDLDLQGAEVAGTIGFEGHQLDIDNDNRALFGQVNFDLRDWLQVSLGARYTEEQKHYKYVETEMDIDGSASSGPGFLATLHANVNPDIAYRRVLGYLTYPDETVFNQVLSFSEASGVQMRRGNQRTLTDRWKLLTPSVSATLSAPQYLLEGSEINQAQLFIGFSQGFKAGGYAVQNEGLQEFDPEITNNLEVGMDLTLLDNRLGFSAALFFINIKDMQQRVTLPRDDTVVGAFPWQTDRRVYNVDKTEIGGMEVSLDTYLLDNLSLSAQLTYLDATYQNFKVRELARDEFGDIIFNGNRAVYVEQDHSGANMLGVPELTLSVVATYNVRSRWGMLIPQLRLWHQDDYSVALEAVGNNASHDSVDAFTLLDFSLGIIPESLQNLQIGFYINNVLGEEYYLGGYSAASSFGISSLVKGNERQFGLTARYRFSL